MVRITSGDITRPHFEERITNCPLCGDHGIRNRYHIRRYIPSFTIDRCDSCGFMFMNPRLTNAVSGDIYDENYYSGKAEYSYYDERQAEKDARHVWDKRVKVIHRYINTGNILDVGSSFGGFLRSAAKYYRPHGIEISGYAGSYSKSATGFTIHAGTLEDHPFGEGYFSAITMIELLEHLSDPAGALRECYRLLSDGGLLLVQTANMDGIQAKIRGDNYAYFMPGHLSYFTRKNLLMVLRQCGFKKIKVFYPVEFGLLPKLLKSKHTFTSPWDYRRWLRIAAYHLISKIHFRNFAATSSMVIYAFK
jgi:2-polyprenyl-3-methyl-5-hydroxy-6-metoxy-1,4-benzoquinol methylase